MNIIKILSLISLISYSGFSYSQTKTSVACTNPYNFKLWKWAKDKSGNAIEVSGYWKLHKVKTTDQAAMYFFITSKEEIEKIRHYCSPDHYVQAADGWYSNWYRFAYVTNEKPFEIEIEPGFWGWHDQGIPPQGRFTGVL